MTGAESLTLRPFCFANNIGEHFRIDLIHLQIHLPLMKPFFRSLIGTISYLLLVGFASGQTKTLTQIELENIQEKQNRLFDSHAKETNPADRETIEHRIIALRDEYQALLSKNQNNVPVLVTFGLYLAQIDQREDSLKLLLKADSLEPQHPQVKNQLGNFMIEEANYALALPYYMGAIALAPTESLYHYQLGSLLYFFQKEFVHDGILSQEHLEKQMFEAFKNAARLAPDNLAYQYRYAEAFYDMPGADMNEALKEWKQIEFNTTSNRDIQLIRLHQANVQLLLGNKDLVPVALEVVTDEDLQENKNKLLKQADQK
jgi:tetratricopeptide (TPR) repeat protein